MQNQQPLQNCHIILRLCEVEQGESLHIHKASQKSVEEMHRGGDCKSAGFSYSVQREQKS